MLRVTLGQLFESQAALRQLAEQSLDFEVSERIAQVIDTISKPLERYAIARTRLIQEKGRNAGNDMFVLTDPDAIEKINRMSSFAIYLTLEEKLKRGTLAGVKLSAVNMRSLSWLIEEPETKPVEQDQSQDEFGFLTDE